MENQDLLFQRLSAYSSLFTKAHQEFNSWILEAAGLINCHDRTNFSAELFEKPNKKTMSKLVFSLYEQMSLIVGKTISSMKDVEE